MKRAYTNGILLDGTEQMQPVEHKILLTEDDKIIAIVDEGVDLDGFLQKLCIPQLLFSQLHAGGTALQGAFHLLVQGLLAHPGAVGHGV